MTNNSSIPSDFICPITHDIMENPVLLVEDGHSYEKSALEGWLQTHNTSPITNAELKTQTFVVNYNLKSAIEEFCRQQNEMKSKHDFRSFTLHQGRSHNDQWKNHPKLRIIISLLGPSGVGKSCLAANIESGQLQENFKARITIGVDVSFFYLDRLFEDQYVVVIQINDCPGNDRFESVDSRHFRDCHGAILMADTTNIDTFERLEGYWYKQLRDKSTFENIEAILACNKIDLLEQNYDSLYREKFFKRADTFASDYQIPIFNISALRGDNIQAMFYQLILNILKNPKLVKILKDSQLKTQERLSRQNSTIKIETSSTTNISEEKKKSTCKC